MKELAPNTYTFAEYELDLTRRLFLLAGQSIPLNAKTFDLLVVLIENRERVIAKEELMNLVWRDQFVEEANLTVQISALRKALGEKKGEHRFIVTVPGRGYRFVADVQNGDAKSDIVSDIVIETHTTSHVLVDEEVVSDEMKRVIDTGFSAVETSQSSPSAYTLDAPRNRSIVGNPQQLPARRYDQVRRSNRLTIAWLAALLGVLFIGGLGFWVYLSRMQNKQSTAPVQSHQLTTSRFTTTGGMPYRVAISPDGKSLAYRQRINGKDSLWLGQIDTSSSVLVHQPTGQSLYTYLAFSPDGGHIYFTMQDERHPQSILVRMPVLGGATTELTSSVHSAVTFSPGGQRIAFIRRDQKTRQSSIMIADATDGKNESAVTSRRLPESFSGGLSWSPDGKTIAVCATSAGRRGEILTVGVADGAVNKMGERDWAEVNNLVWLSDGSGLVMVGRDRGRNNQIWLVTYPSGETHNLTNDLNHYHVESLSMSAGGKLAVLRGQIRPSIWIAPDDDARQARRILEGTETSQEGLRGLAWTPAGHLIYAASVGDSRTIWETNGTGNHRQLIPHQANAVDNLMCVTADSRYVIFQSDRSGSSEIWRANLDGGDLKQLTAGGDNSQPSLSPDGRWVVYTSEREGTQRIWRVPVDGGEATRVTDRPSSWPQISPDGKHIAYAQPTDIEPSEGPLQKTSGRADIRLIIIPFAGEGTLKSYPVPLSAALGRGSLTWTRDGKAIMYKDLIRGLWRQALDEEEPQPVKSFEEIRVYHLARSFDGQSLAYTSGTATREIVLIENFK